MNEYFSYISNQRTRNFRRFLVKLLSVCALLFGLHTTQGQAVTEVRRVSGQPCVGSSLTFGAIGGPVHYWTVLGTDYTINNGGGTNNWIIVTWHSPQSGVGVRANGGETAWETIHERVSPSVSFTKSTSSICQGDEVTFTASSTNAGASPNYTWFVDDEIVPSERESVFKTTTLASGNRSIKVQVAASGGTGCFNVTETAIASPQTVSVQAPSPISVTLIDPGPVCETSTGWWASVSGAGSNQKTYKWYVNGGLRESNPSAPDFVYDPISDVVTGDRLQCKVITSGCVSPREAWSNEIIIQIREQQHITGDFSIGVSKLNYCEGEEITFEAISPNNSNVTVHYWLFNGLQYYGDTFSTTEFTQDSEVRLHATASPKGFCIIRKDFTGTVSSNSIPLVITSFPDHLTVVPEGPVVLTSEEEQELSIPSITGSNYQVQWKRNGVTIPGATGTTYTATTSGSYSADIRSSTCVETSTTTEIVKNSLPVAAAGNDIARNLSFGLTELTLDASGSYDSDGTITFYNWSIKSGNELTMTDPFNAVITLSDFQVGETILELRVTDDAGESATDEVRIVINDPPNNNNYVRASTIRREGMTSLSSSNQQNRALSSVRTSFYDGLGRPRQTMLHRASTSGNDLITPITYDAYGRQEKNYLPYVHAPANMEPDAAALTNQKTYNDARYGGNNGDYAFSQTLFEPSPLNRPLKQAAPGKAWQLNENPDVTTDHVMRYAYEANVDAEVKRWSINTGETLPVPDGTYPAGELVKQTTTDEDRNRTVEYTNKEGLVVLKKSSTGDASLPWAETYYIHDDFNQLRVVLSPEATNRLSSEFDGQSTEDKQAFLARWCYQYDYDDRQRMTRKQVPGADAILLIYDQWDRLALTQDGKQRTNGQWLFTKYDHLNRPVMTGLMNGEQKQKNERTWQIPRTSEPNHWVLMEIIRT